MEQLPLETLMDIVGFACTDGGYTARSLLLSCRSLNMATRPVRFQSVALEPGSQDYGENIKGFLGCLEAERASMGLHAASKVRHLFLATRPTIPAATLTGGSILSSFGAILDRAANPTLALLRAVAADLETLTLIGNVIADYDALPVFPVLRELTYGGADRLPSRTIRPDIGRPFPALERLHCYSSGTLHLIVDRLAPRLTHLRVSGASSGYSACNKTVLEACNVTADSEQIGTHAAGQPARCPRMELVVVQPSPAPTEAPGSKGEHNVGLAEHNDHLSALWSALKNSAVPVYVLPPDKSEDPREIRMRKTARAYWVARIEGGEGCWAVAPEYAHSAQKGDVPPDYLVAKS